jgi:ribosomal protein S18 acetylase RimI-like enzyme
MITRILLESDAQQYQSLRLHALLTNPEAFGSTYERESQFTREQVKERIRPTQEKFVLGAFDEQEMLVGFVTLVRDPGMKTAHKANIYGMFVKNEYRRQGVGRALMQELIRLSRNMEGLEQLNLCVVANNEQAKRLYQSMGFETYGIERNALKFNDQYCDEEFMVLRLNRVNHLNQQIIQIRIGTDHDLDLLAQVNQQLIEDEMHDNPMDLDQLKERMGKFIHSVYKAYLFYDSMNQVRGYALVDHSKEPLYLRQFFICRDSREQGYGRTAFETLMDFLGTDRIDIEVYHWNVRGYRFWKSLGFKERSIYMRLEK